MKLYVTEIDAIDPKDGEMKVWFGPYISAISFADARKYCDNNGLGYCRVVSELLMEIDSETGDRIDYDLAQNN